MDLIGMGTDEYRGIEAGERAPSFRVEFAIPFGAQEAGEGTVDKVWRWSA